VGLWDKIINGLGLFALQGDPRDCNMAGVRKLSSAFSLTTINNKPPSLRVYSLGWLRSTIIRNESPQKYLRFGRYCSLDLLDNVISGATSA
jgi:hypothetical protein